MAIFTSSWVERKAADSKVHLVSGLYIPAVALILLGALSYGAPIAITLLVIAMGFNASHMCGYQVNHIDLSPTHAGILMGITNAAANVCSFLAPMLVQYLVIDNVSTLALLEVKAGTKLFGVPQGVPTSLVLVSIGKNIFKYLFRNL